MANQLKVTTVHSILTLRDRGWSQRRIARELGIHRETVGRYVRRAAEGAEATNRGRDIGDPKPAKPAHGSNDAEPPPGLPDPRGSQTGQPAHGVRATQPM